MFGGFEVDAGGYGRAAYTGNNEANAHLISAAPELYEALAAAMDQDRQRYAKTPEAQAHFERNNAKALAALRKARGEHNDR